MLDADGGNPQVKLNSVTKLLSMITENDMCDIYRIRYRFSKRYTWRQKLLKAHRDERASNLTFSNVSI